MLSRAVDGHGSLGAAIMELLKSHQVLVLNSSYEAINICNARRAIILLLKGAADTITHSDAQVHAATRAWNLPEVIRLHRYIKIPYRPIPFCRKNVFLRDNHSCQYCGKQNSADHLTIDHVLPTSRGGKDGWANVATACRECNHAKGNRTPDEASMPLLFRPTHPHLPSYLHLVRLMGAKRAQWRKYLYYDEPSTMAG